MSSFKDIQSQLISLYNSCFYTFSEEVEEKLIQEINDVTLKKENIILSAGSNKLKYILNEIHQTKVRTNIMYEYQGCRWQWIMADLERSEELVKYSQYKWAYDIIQYQWKKIYSIKCNAAYKIQKHWKYAITNPSYKVCQNRLQWEFNNL